MKYNFDEVIDRDGSHSVKIELMKVIWQRDDLLPLWVADMDFKTPPFIIDVIKKRLQHEVLGYTYPHEGYYTAVVNWVRQQYNMIVGKEHIHFIPGIVPGINMAVNALTEKGDKIMIQPPVYHPFKQVIDATGRILINNPLKWENGYFKMDFDTMRACIKGCKLFILCHPHNPGGVVWEREELEKLAGLCAENNTLVISDEIHADLTLSPNKHLPFAMVSEAAKQNSITFMAPSKTFNMPGLVASHAIVFNERLRERFFTYIVHNDLDMGNVFSYLAVEAAYTEGKEWLEQVLSYLRENITYVEKYINDRMPKIKAILPQASFLIFLDCRALNFSTQEELENFFTNKARLALNSGATFGENGKGFMRLNIATPRSTLEKAMSRLEKAYVEEGF